MQRKSTVTVISFNLQSTTEKQTKWISNHILTKKPDVILFQEVNNGILLKLVEKLRNHSYHYKIANERRKTYELIASRWPITNHSFKRYSTSRRGHGILWANLNIFNDVITVASTQLDQENIHKRIGQLDCILDFFAERGNSTIIGCDTGFLRRENYNLEGTDWNDAWWDAGRNKFAQYTIDCNRNKNTQMQARPDRIYYIGEFDEPTFELIGTQTTEQPFHFAIKLTLQLLINK